MVQHLAEHIQRDKPDLYDWPGFINTAFLLLQFAPDGSMQPEGKKVLSRVQLFAHVHRSIRRIAKRRDAVEDVDVQEKLRAALGRSYKFHNVNADVII